MVSLSLASELPYPPEGFSVFDRGDDFVTVVWFPAPSSDIRPVGGYVLELTYQERGTITSTRVGQGDHPLVSIQLCL